MTAAAGKRVLLLATTTGYQIRSFGEAADRLGVRLVLASDRCDRLEDPWCDGALPIRFHDVSESTRVVVAAFQAAPPDGIVAVGDWPTVLAAHLAAAFGMPGNPPEAAAASRNKLATRRAFQAAGLPTPAFHSVPTEGDPASLARAVPYPAVIKPVALSGSRGVIRVDDPREFGAAFARVRRLLQSPDVLVERDSAHGEIVVESFIPGREFAVEGVLTHGVFRPLAVFDKPDPLDGPFFEETIYVTPTRQGAETDAAIVKGVAAAARALGLRHGPVHAECRVNDGGVFVLEAAARPIGGLCSRALRFAAGGATASLEEVLLRHALGEDVEAYSREGRASGVMMIPIPRRGIYRGVEGLVQARGVAGVDDVVVTAKPDSALVPLPEGRSYLGFIFARASRPDAVEGALRAAHSHLRFQIDREVALTRT